MIRVPVQITIPERYFWETADIIVKKKDDKAVAIKTDTREVIAENIDHAYVIQKAIDYLSALGGGKVFISAGEYIIKSTITVKDNIVLEGAGYNTVLKAGADGMQTLLQTNKTNNIIIRNLHLDGDYKAYTLLGFFTGDGVVSENIVAENIWIHSNKRGVQRSILWAWDIDQSYNIKHLRLRNIYGWDIDTGVANHDNIAFSFVEDVVVEDSYFEIERVFIFFYTKHARARNVYVKASEYATFVVDSGSDDTVLENCISYGAVTRVYGSDTVIRGGYYYHDILFGDSNADWYGKDVVIDGAYIFGDSPIQIYGEKAIIRNCRIVTGFDHAVKILWRSDIPRKPVFVLIEGNTISNGDRTVYCILIGNAEKVIIKNNRLEGSGWGIVLANDPEVRIVDNIFDVGSRPVYLSNFTGKLIAMRNKGYQPEGVTNVLSDCANLPASGYYIGEMIACYDTGTAKWVLKVWDGSAWQTIG